MFLLDFPPKQETAPGAVIAIQTFGDFLNFNPHCHVLCTDGGFYASATFKVAQAMETEPLEKIFQHKVLGMLLRKGKITEEVGQAHHVVASFPVCVRHAQAGADRYPGGLLP